MSNHTDTSTAPASLVSVRGGKVHQASAYYLAEYGLNVPACRTMDRNSQHTRFTQTGRPVDCKTCLSYPVQVAEELGVR